MHDEYGQPYEGLGENEVRARAKVTKICLPFYGVWSVPHLRRHEEKELKRKREQNKEAQAVRLCGKVKEYNNCGMSRDGWEGRDAPPVHWTRQSRIQWFAAVLLHLH